MQSLIQTTLYLLTILIPLTFTTINSELFEFPKFILLLSGTLVISVAWLLDHFYLKNKTAAAIPLTPITYGVVAILATQLIATLFSINPYTSFWGYYSRFHQGLLTTICYTILYFAATKYLNNNSAQKIIKISVGTSFIISLYAILQRLGIDKSLWVQDVVNRPFSTLGQPNWLAAYLLPNFFLSLYLFQKNKPRSLFVGLVNLAIFTALLLTKSRSGFLALVLSYPTYWFLLSRQFSFPKIKKNLLFSAVSLTIIALLIGTPYTPKITSLFTPPPAAQTSLSVSGTQLENGGTESGDIRKIVWTGALNLIKKNPILGTGPETFAYTYYWERPLAHNNTSEWDYLYNKAHNEYLNLAATTGLVGLLAYLYFHFAIFKSSFTLVPRTKKINQNQEDAERHYYPVLGAMIVSFTITNFFGFSVIPVYLLVVLVASLPPILTNNQDSSNGSLSLPLSLLPLLILLYPAKLFVADLAYARGKAYLDAGQPASALSQLQSATNARPGLDLYHSALGEAYVQLNQKDLALKEAELTRRLNPYHLNYHKSRAKIYLTLAGSDSAYYTQAAAELKDASRLAPTDPKLSYNLGLVYTRLGDNDLAAAAFKEAIKLKPNYESPYYALTLLYEQTNQKNLVPELLQSAEQNLATYSSALADKIKIY